MTFEQGLVKMSLHIEEVCCSNCVWIMYILLSYSCLPVSVTNGPKYFLSSDT